MWGIGFDLLRANASVGFWLGFVIASEGEVFASRYVCLNRIHVRVGHE